MYNVYDWAEARTLLREGRSVKVIADRLSMSRTTVYRLLSLDKPPHYDRPRQPSLLDPHRDRIRALLRQEPKIPSTIILERIREDGYRGGITILKDFVAQVRPDFVAAHLYQRTVYLPGELIQVDWWAPRCGVSVGKGHKREVFGLVGVLPYSAAHAVVFAFSHTLADFISALPGILIRLGGLPRAAVFDRDSSIVVPRSRRVHPEVAALLGALGMRAIVLPPASPESKGVVERTNGYLETSFLPARTFADLSDLQGQADEWATGVAWRRPHRRVGTRPEVALATEKAQMAPLPDIWPDTDRKSEARVSRDNFVRAGDVDYSVPPGHAGRRVAVRLSPTECRVFCEGREIASHVRSFVPADVVLDPAHAEALVRAKAARRRLESGDVEVELPDLSCYDALVGVV